MNKYQYVCENYKKPKPILFNTEMVQAILEGRKGQTRRPIDVDISNNFDCDPDGTVVAYMNPETGDMYDPLEIAPYKQGDILYVRETFSPNFFPDDSPVYKASCPKSGWSEIRWKPSIFMPKEAARIFLRVTDVRVERLQDIDHTGIRAEGCLPDCVCGGEFETLLRKYWIPLWDSINAKRGYSWDSNPWVWVIKFERVEI